MALASEGAILNTNTEYVAVDIETTGISTARDRIIEIAAVRFRGTERISETNWLVNPERHIPAGATRVHGITDDMVASAPLFRDIYPALKVFIGDTSLIAHNAHFDVRFIAAEFRRGGLDPIHKPVIDSLSLSRRYIQSAPAHNLEALSRFLDLKGSAHHRALADAMYVYQLIKFIIVEAEKHGRQVKLEEHQVQWPEESP
jgi:DNA polymerase III epsilon subunit family exonuclease